MENLIGLSALVSRATAEPFVTTALPFSPALLWYLCIRARFGSFFIFNLRPSLQAHSHLSYPDMPHLFPSVYEFQAVGHSEYLFFSAHAEIFTRGIDKLVRKRTSPHNSALLLNSRSTLYTISYYAIETFFKQTSDESPSNTSLVRYRIKYGEARIYEYIIGRDEIDQSYSL